MIMDDMDIDRARKISRAIAAVLRLRDMTVSDLAQAVGANPRTFEGRLQRGSLSAVQLLAIADVLRLDVKLLGRDCTITVSESSGHAIIIG